VNEFDGEFPGWHVWMSDKGYWYATRGGAGPRLGGDEHRPMTVHAPSRNELRDVLAGALVPCS
jgi:hypothetical protein